MSRILSAMLLMVVLAFGALPLRAQEPLRVVTTTTQITDLVRVLAGDLIGSSLEVTSLMGPGVDPHLYQPTESDVAAMSNADVVFYSGLFLEGRMGELFETLGERGVKTYAVSQPVKDAGYTIGGFNLSAEFSNVDDPHFWFDPRNWELAAVGLSEQLAEIDPANAETYSANVDAYVLQLQSLYAWAQEAMSQVPEEQRILVTSHDAFQYFGDSVGWEVRGLQGISTQTEAGVGDIQELAQFIADNRIPVIFVESSVPPNAIRAVQEAVRAAAGQVSVGERVLYSDAMGDADSFGGTYIGMLASNVIAIVEGFGYSVPEFPPELGTLPEDLLQG